MELKILYKAARTECYSGMFQSAQRHGSQPSGHRMKGGYIVVMVLAKIAGINSITFFTIVEIFTIVNPIGFQTATALRDFHSPESRVWTA